MEKSPLSNDMYLVLVVAQTHNNPLAFLAVDHAIRTRKHDLPL